MSTRDVVSSPDAEPKAVETQPSPVLQNGETRVSEPDKTSGSIKPVDRLVTTSAVAAALAEVQGADAQIERPKRRRIDRRHSGLEPLVEAEKHTTDPALPNGHRMSAPTIESVPGSVTEVVIKPMRLGSASPRSQLKRATSTHLAGIRERLKAVKQVDVNGVTTSTVKRTPNVATMPIFKRIPNSSATPTFRSVAKAVAAGTAITSGGKSAEQGQNYEQMMARFQLRRLEPTDSGGILDTEAKVLNRRSTAYVPVDSETSQRRMDDLMNLSHARSEGELIDNTIGREDDSDIHSRAEESPRRPGAPSFHSNAPSIAPPPTATVTPVVDGVLGGSTRSIGAVVKKPHLSTLEQEPVRGFQQGEKPEQGQGQLQQLATRRDSVDVTTLDQRVFPKRNSRSGGRPRPLPRFKRRARAILTRLQTPLSPFSWTARVRSFFLLLAFCVHILGFPYENAFHGGGTAWFLSLDSMTEMVFFADFLLVFNTSFVNKRGVLVVSRRHIAWNFLNGACVVHFLAAIPVVTIVVIWNGGAEGATRVESENDAFGRFYHTLVDIVFRYHRIVHILRVLGEVGQVRGARIDKSVLGWLLYSRYSHLLRIVWIVGTVMIIAHCVACCWRLLLIDAADADPSPIAEGTCGAPIDTSIELEVYTECFYVAMQSLLGQSISTHSARENIFASCVNLLGSIVLAVIFGEVAMLVANFNANSTTYQRKMESVFAGMTKMQLPAPLRERIHQYYAHLWREYEALDGASLGRFAKELSHNLTLEVVLFKYMELAMHVPFWENCSPDFQKTLVLSLDTRVYLPDDFIVRRGEVGDEFYMINRGMCELVGNTDTQEHATEPLARRRSVANEHHGDTSSLYTTSQDGTVYPDRDDLGRGARKAARYAHVNPEGFTQANALVKTLTRGQAFGEMALLMNYQRTANVRAMTYVEMCVLSRTAFQAVLTRYPVDRKHVISQILISSLENNERFGIPCPLTAMVRSVFADEVDGGADSEKFITPRRAAKLVAWAVNPDVEDDSIKFALNAKLKDQLVVVRDQEITAPTQDEETSQQGDAITTGASTSLVISPTGTRKRSNDDHKHCHCGCHNNGSSVENTSNRPEPDDSHVVKLENVQAQALTLLQELQRGVQDSINPPSAPQQAAQATNSPVVDPNPNAEASKPVITIQQRRSRFISSRSTSAPNFADLDVTERRNSNLNLNETVNNTAKPQEKPPSTTPPKPIQ